MLERFFQQLCGVGFDLHSLSPGSCKTAHRPVGQELCIAIETASCLSKATTDIGGKCVRERIGASGQEAVLLQRQDAFCLFVHNFHESIFSCYRKKERLYYNRRSMMRQGLK